MVGAVRGLMGGGGGGGGDNDERRLQEVVREG